MLRTRTTGETRGFMKALLDAQADRILDFTMIGPEAGEVMPAGRETRQRKAIQCNLATPWAKGRGGAEDRPEWMSQRSASRLQSLLDVFQQGFHTFFVPGQGKASQRP